MAFDVSGDLYDRFMGRYSRRLAPLLVDFARIEPGQRVLDVGCGPGALTAALAERVGPENVVAVDPSPPFVATCSERVPGARVLEATAESLPAGPFDAVVSQLVVNFLPDPVGGVRAMSAVARPGGAVAACVWDYAGEMEMLRAFWDGALELDPGAPDEGRTMRNCSPDELERLWREAGLDRVETAALDVVADYDDFEDYWAPFPTGVAPAGAYCASLAPAQQERVREACFRRLGSPAGSFALRGRAWAVRGEAG